MENRDKGLKGRGSLSRVSGRYEVLSRIDATPQWPGDIEAASNKTSVTRVPARSVISYNRSPDVPFSRSINPYQGCEHGCVYCFARPTHAYFGLSAGLDFEQKLFARINTPEILKQELNKKNYRPEVIALGANTDTYQPIEREYEITRNTLKVLRDFRHPTVIITKSSMIERDIDILSEMAKDRLIKVIVSVTTLDKELARRLEPRASSPGRRLTTIARLQAAGIPVGVLVAPVIPALTCQEIEDILRNCADSGATSANYVMLRLPLELQQVFDEWLTHHYPHRRDRVINQIKSTRSGKLYDSHFGQRMTGSGPIADMIAQRFLLAVRKLGLNKNDIELDTQQFRRHTDEKQLSLF